MKPLALFSDDASPPTWSLASSSVKLVWPSSRRRYAAARPVGPAPMMTIFCWSDTTVLLCGLHARHACSNESVDGVVQRRHDARTLAREDAVARTSRRAPELTSRARDYEVG